MKNYAEVFALFFIIILVLLISGVWYGINGQNVTRTNPLLVSFISSMFIVLLGWFAYVKYDEGYNISTLFTLFGILCIPIGIGLIITAMALIGTPSISNPTPYLISTTITLAIIILFVIIVPSIQQNIWYIFNKEY